MVINYDRCIGCRTCVAVCPFGAARYDAVRNRPIKCELCDGDPQCVKMCPTEAMKFLPKSLANMPKMNRIMQKVVGLGPVVPEQVPTGEAKHDNS
jgi:Fe-S-cluster-containing hydrogenase component 2